MSGSVGRMLRHVVMMRLTDEATEADRAAIVDGLRALPDLIPEIRSYSVGTDAGLAEGNFELVVVGDFDDDEGYTAYATNADHQAVIALRIRPFLAERAAVQYRT